MKNNVVISWSSGKDSTLVLERLRDNPEFNVVALYTTYVKDEVPFQATPLYVLDIQAQLLNLPLIKIELPQTFPPNEVYQARIIESLQASGFDIDAVAFGDMFCNGIADYRRSYIEPAGWQCLFPLMGEKSHKLAQEILHREIKTLVVTTDGNTLGNQFCGQWYNQAFLAALPENIDPCGENGEFHTLVTQTRSYQGSIEITPTHIDSDGRFSYQRYTAERLPKSSM